MKMITVENSSTASARGLMGFASSFVNRESAIKLHSIVTPRLTNETLSC